MLFRGCRGLGGLGKPKPRHAARAVPRRDGGNFPQRIFVVNQFPLREFRLRNRRGSRFLHGCKKLRRGELRDRIPGARVAIKLLNKSLVALAAFPVAYSETVNEVFFFSRRL